MGHIVLQGGGEFAGEMAKSDGRAMALAGGADAEIAIIPMAAAPDRNHERAGSNGQSWFTTIGARRVEVLPLIDTQSAGDPEVVASLKRAKMIYLLGGFPGYLALTLTGSAAWKAVIFAYQHGAVVAGSSAGAMVLCDRLYDPYHQQLLDGMGLVAGCCVVPHHDTTGNKWVTGLQKQLPELTIIGIDEQTGMIDDGPDGRWNVYGRGAVTIYCANQVMRYESGTPFGL